MPGYDQTQPSQYVGPDSQTIKLCPNTSLLTCHYQWIFAKEHTTIRTGFYLMTNDITVAVKITATYYSLIWYTIVPQS